MQNKDSISPGLLLSAVQDVSSPLFTSPLAVWKSCLESSETTSDEEMFHTETLPVTQSVISMLCNGILFGGNSAAKKAAVIVSLCFEEIMECV